MEYQVFALKWRPQDFDEVVGQEHIITNLKNAILKNRLPYAFLFSGPHGVGKTSVARILAKSLNCQQGPTIKPCQKCSNCIEITEARSLDVIEIDGASNRGIDEIRALRENVKFAPTKSRFKIYIIDEVHMLTTEAFNALLKTLEEPPSFVKFIFATTQPHKVIPTIISRCQRFNFKRIPLNKIIQQLKKIITQQNIQLSDEILLSIAKASQGSLRDAESLLDQVISFKGEKLSTEEVISVLGMVEIEILFSLTDLIIQKDPQGLIKFLNKIIQEGKDLGVLLSNLIEHFRNLLIARISKQDFSILDLPLEVSQRLYQQSQAFSVEELISFFNALVNIQEMTKKIDSLSIPLEVGLIKLCYQKKSTSKENVLLSQERELSTPTVDKEETKKVTTDKEELENDPKESASTDSIIKLEEISEHWSEVIDFLKEKKMSVASYLQGGILKEIKNNDTLVIAFAKDNSFHKEFLEKKENREIIEKAIESIFKVRLKLNLVVSKEETAKKEENPFIKSILETFNARPINREL